MTEKNVASAELIDPISANAFLWASETLNFTLAAKMSGMTQSGVSQHVSRLERGLGVELFTRVNRKVRLTSAGVALKAYLQRCSADLISLKEELVNEVSSLKGIVSYSMPSSCLQSPHFGLLLKERAWRFPLITLHVSILTNEDVVRAILSKRVDFGFVTTAVHQPGISFTPFCKEDYVLVGPSSARIPASPSLEMLKGLPMIDYPGAKAVFSAWVGLRIPSARIVLEELPCVGRITELQGVLTLLEAQVGFTVIARHCIEPLITAKKIGTFMDKGPPVENQIYIAQLASRRIPKRVEVVTETFFEILRQKN